MTCACDTCVQVARHAAASMCGAAPMRAAELAVEREFKVQVFHSFFTSASIFIKMLKEEHRKNNKKLNKKKTSMVEHVVEKHRNVMSNFIHGASIFIKML